MLRRLLQTAVAKASIVNKKLYGHTLRYLFSNHSLEAGTEPQIVQ